MSQGFESLERLEDAQKNKYFLIDTLDDVWNRTGYFFAGFSASATAADNKYKLQVMKDGAVLASTALYWWDVTLAAMGTESTRVSAIPDGYKQAIDYLAAKKYWESLGSAAHDKQCKYFTREYESLIAKAKEKWDTPTRDAEWCESVDSDAGEFGNTFIHRVS